MSFCSVSLYRAQNPDIVVALCLEHPPHRSVVQSLAWKPTETFEYLLVLSGSAFSMNNDKNL